ncbi:MAG: hypothetical protein H6721_23935 [Sandaracinus sp.]|nr:hypothetical protein [Sandaracinus sp.]
MLIALARVAFFYLDAIVRASSIARHSFRSVASRVTRLALNVAWDCRAVAVGPTTCTLAAGRVAELAPSERWSRSPRRGTVPVRSTPTRFDWCFASSRRRSTSAGLALLDEEAASTRSPERPWGGFSVANSFRRTRGSHAIYVSVVASDAVRDERGLGRHRRSGWCAHATKASTNWQVEGLEDEPRGGALRGASVVEARWRRRIERVGRVARATSTCAGRAHV